MLVEHGELAKAAGYELARYQSPATFLTTYRRLAMRLRELGHFMPIIRSVPVPKIPAPSSSHFNFDHTRRLSCAANGGSSAIIFSILASNSAMSANGMPLPRRWSDRVVSYCRMRQAARTLSKRRRMSGPAIVAASNIVSGNLDSFFSSTQLPGRTKSSPPSTARLDGMGLICSDATLTLRPRQ